VTGQPVTTLGMRLRGMRLLVHRGQVLLLLVVGVLAGVAIAGFCLQMDGASILGALRINQVFSPPGTELPSQIVIGHAVAPTNDAGLGGAAAANAAPAVADPASPHPVEPTPTTAVVPGVVYTYPPDDHGGGGTPGGDGHGGRGG
jgi:hypothetical protein